MRKTRHFRWQLEITQEAFCQAVELRLRRLQQLESGADTPTFSELRLIVRELKEKGVTSEQLREGFEEE